MTQVRIKTYTHDEVLEASIKYFHGDALAATTWMQKYALKDSMQSNSGELKYLELTPDDMHKRIASELARIESKYPNGLDYVTIYNLIKDFKYIVPQGGPMAGIGNHTSIQSLSNCFVIGNKEDSYGAIFQTDQELVQLMKRRGGVGTDLSYIRPASTKVSNAALTSSGAVSFMERFSNSTREVSQRGRRGALMLSISIKHPDAEDFIDAKLDLTKVTGANISVKITTEFMNAVNNNEYFLQTFPINSNPNKILNSKKPDKIGELQSGKQKGTYYRWIDAKKLWDKIMYNAWKSAEPGILFWDTIISESPADQYAEFGFATESTNPCSELPLCPYDSCRLFALNLYSFIENPFTKNAKFNYDLFYKYSSYAQRLMDDVIDLEVEKIDNIISKINSDPESDSTKSVELNLWMKIKEMALKGRRTGLGVTAEGDALAALGLRYGSKESINEAEKIHKYLAMASYYTSIKLAEERGSFDCWSLDRDLKSPFVNRVMNALELILYKDITLTGRRNIANLTLAPTGSVSILTQTTSGIEPAFRIVYKRRRKTTDKSKAVFTDKMGDMFEEYTVFHHKFVEWYRLGYLENDPDITHEIALSTLQSMSDEQLTELISQSPYHKSTAEDIDWVDKVRMQGVIQKWIDHSISCTVNIPSDSTVELVNDIYMEAWKSGCKGATIYRDGSRDGVLISKDSESKSKENSKITNRPKEIEAVVTRFRNGNENWLAFIGLIDNKPWEIFTGKIDDDIKYLPKSITNGKIIKVDTVNEAEHHRYDFQYEIEHGYINTLPDIGNAFNPEYYNYARIVSAMLQEDVKLAKITAVLSKLKCGDTINAWNRGVVRALKKFIADGVKTGVKCEYCGAELVYYNGCTTCPGCGRGGKCD